MGKKTGLAFGAGKAGYLPLRKSLAERAYDILEEAIITLGLAVELQRKVSHYLQPILSHRFLNNLA